MTEDLVSVRYGNLTVIEKIGKRNRSTFWKCKCDCGNFVDRSTGELNRSIKNSKTTSCRNCAQRTNRSKDLGESSWRHIFNSYLAGAKKRDLEFLLTQEEFKKLCSGNCYFCGIEPKNFNRYRTLEKIKIGKVSNFTADRAWIKANGVDRLNPDIGYNLENCVSCCSICNYIKLDLNENQFLESITKIYKHKNKI